MTSLTAVPCPVCRQPLTLRPAQGRKSGKSFLMLVCLLDGRHFRGFINDRDYVDSVLALLESHTPSFSTEPDVDNKPTANSALKTILGQHNS
jgi:hypothetical protein